MGNSLLGRDGLKTRFKGFLLLEQTPYFIAESKNYAVFLYQRNKLGMKILMFIVSLLVGTGCSTGPLNFSLAERLETHKRNKVIKKMTLGVDSYNSGYGNGFLVVLDRDSNEYHTTSYTGKDPLSAYNKHRKKVTDANNDMLCYWIWNKRFILQPLILPCESMRDLYKEQIHTKISIESQKRKIANLFVSVEKIDQSVAENKVQISATKKDQVVSRKLIDNIQSSQLISTGVSELASMKSGEIFRYINDLEVKIVQQSEVLDLLAAEVRSALEETRK